MVIVSVYVCFVLVSVSLFFSQLLGRFCVAMSMSVTSRAFRSSPQLIICSLMTHPFSYLSKRWTPKVQYVYAFINLLLYRQQNTLSVIFHT